MSFKFSMVQSRCLLRQKVGIRLTEYMSNLPKNTRKFSSLCNDSLCESVKPKKVLMHDRHLDALLHVPALLVRTHEILLGIVP